MASEWQTIKLSDVLGKSGYIRGPFGSALRRPELKSEGIPVYEQQHAIYNTRTFRFFIDEDKFNELSRFTVQENDLIISCSGTLGKVSLIRKDDPKGIISQALLILRPDTNIMTSKYLYYFISSVKGYNSLVSVSSGSVQVNIAKRSVIENTELLLPPLPEQRAIAAILGSLDDKIELNSRINQTLEAMAQAIFKSWFVDFEPVRAKADGRDPGLPKQLAELFPNSFEDSELGEIPKGWRVVTVNDVAEINAKTLSSSDELEVIDYIEISEVMRGDVGTIVRYKRGAEPSRARRCLRHGDSVLSTVRPDRGAHFLCLNPPATLIASTGFAVLSPRDGKWAFLYSALTQPTVGDDLGRLADGGAYPAIRPEAIGALEFVIPKASYVLTAFQKLVAPPLERAQQNRTESKTLAALRDTLLPKLISSEIRIQDAERIIERNI